jgi:hypothetical protein
MVAFRNVQLERLCASLPEGNCKQHKEPAYYYLALSINNLAIYPTPLF